MSLYIFYSCMLLVCLVISALAGLAIYNNFREDRERKHRKAAHDALVAKYGLKPNGYGSKSGERETPDRMERRSRPSGHLTGEYSGLGIQRRNEVVQQQEKALQQRYENDRANRYGSSREQVLMDRRDGDEKYAGFSFMRVPLVADSSFDMEDKKYAEQQAVSTSEPVIDATNIRVEASSSSSSADTSSSSSSDSSSGGSSDGGGSGGDW